jgi:hypothetical protein
MDRSPAPRHYLAQLNVGRMQAPLDSLVMEPFMSRLDEINGLADGSPGFVWRLKSDSGNATDIRVDDDPTLLFNLSLWDSIQSLRDFVYRSRHLDLLRRRREFFVPLGEEHLVLWWVPSGHFPSLQEARQRLGDLRARGATQDAFTLRAPFAAPNA